MVCGRKGSGKSTYIKLLLKFIECFIVFDYHHEHTNLGFPVYDPKQIAILWTKGVKRLIYLPRYRSLEELEEIARIAKNLRNLVLVVDEMDRLVEKKQSLNKTEIGDLVHGGRHYGVGLISATRRFADLHEAFVSQADWTVFFSQHSSGDMDRLEKELGPEALRIASMPPYYFGEFNHRTNALTWYKKLQV